MNDNEKIIDKDLVIEVNGVVKFPDKLVNRTGEESLEAFKSPSGDKIIDKD